MHQLLPLTPETREQVTKLLEHPEVKSYLIECAITSIMVNYADVETPEPISADEMRGQTRGILVLLNEIIQ